MDRDEIKCCIGAVLGPLFGLHFEISEGGKGVCCYGTSEKFNIGLADGLI